MGTAVLNGKHEVIEGRQYNDRLCKETIYKAEVRTDLILSNVGYF